MFEGLIIQFGTLVGVAALVAALVNVAKVFGLPDGYAPNLSAGLSLVAFAVLVALKMFEPSVDVSALDSKAADVAGLVLYILGFVMQMGLPAQFHKLLSGGGVPVIGTSQPKG
jgi:hypothetical protein